MNIRRVLIGIGVILAVFVAVWVVLQNMPAREASVEGTSTPTPPLLIKSMPVRLGTYNAKTGKAGDVKFTQMKLQFNRLFMDYGFVIPASSAGAQKTNPQPTFIVPLGTKVRSLVDGVVVSMPVVWSGDYSIMVASDTSSRFMYETEHVIKPVVKVGDRVTAGQVIAEVSDYDSRNTPGYGLVEIGILKGGNPPMHLCPFLYLDPAIKETVYSQLRGLYKDWNVYRGTKIYNTAAYPVPGCITTADVPG